MMNNRENSDSESSQSQTQEDLVFCFDFQQPRGCQWPLCKYIHCRPEEERMYRIHGTMTDTVREQVDKGIGLTHPICKDFLNNCCNRSRCRFRHQRPNRSIDYQQQTVDSLRKEVDQLKREVSDLRLTNNLLLQINSDLRIRLGSNSLGPPNFPLTLCAASNVISKSNHILLPDHHSHHSSAGGVLSYALSSLPQLISHYRNYPAGVSSATSLHTLPCNLRLPTTALHSNIGCSSLLPPNNSATSSIGSAMIATLMAAAVTSPSSSIANSISTIDFSLNNDT
ncbi:hypothetical protein GJ496_011559 [Pomphorhynchus laevis]|nr:hypothetical protein GJ496_011559 [Pomphorhynchus laevis]